MASGDTEAIDELAGILGRRVVERRERVLAISRTQLARRLGITQPALRDIEHGAVWPRPWHLRALRDALGVSLAWLLGDQVSQDEVDVGRWVLALPPSLRGALLLSASDRPDVPPAPPALTDGPTAPLPSEPTAEPAPPPPPASDPAEDEAPRRTASTRTRRGA